MNLKNSEPRQLMKQKNFCRSIKKKFASLFIFSAFEKSKLKKIIIFKYALD